MRTRPLASLSFDHLVGAGRNDGAVGAPTISPRASRGQGNDDLSKVVAALHQRERLGGGLERESAVDHGPELVRRNRPVHRLKARARADRDTLDADHRAEQSADVNDGLEPADKAHDADKAAEGGGGERLGQRRRAAGLDHDVDSAPAGHLPRRGGPLRHGSVIIVASTPSALTRASFSSLEASATTRAPASLASWSANIAPPPVPSTSTQSPGLTRPSCGVDQAVSAAIGSVAASASVRYAGAVTAS